MNIEIYTDGACRGNQFDQNLGAWAYLITYNNAGKTYYYKVEKNTTNNIMELTAVIEALDKLYKFSEDIAKTDNITVYSDSTYVVMGITTWFKGWIKNNWKHVKNAELWKRLFELKNKFKNIKFQHIFGHSGNKGNEFVDSLCNKAMDDFEKEQT